MSCILGCKTPETTNRAPVLEDPSDLAQYDGDGPWYTCDPKAIMQPRVAKTGPASLETLKMMSFPELFQEAAEKNKSKDLLLVERPCPPLDAQGKAPPALPKEQWTKWTYEDAFKEIKTAAAGFVALGMEMNDSINIWGFNAPEWFISTHAAMFAGGKVAGLYPTDTGETAAYKVVHAGGSIVVIEDKGKLDKLKKSLDDRGDCKRLKAIVAYGFEPAASETVAIKGCGSVPLLSWKALLAAGTTVASPSVLSERNSQIKPGSCSTLIYTSGTTGMPKAVMISHDNIIFTASTVLGLISKTAGSGDERMLSYLPLSHVAGMMIDLVSPWTLGLQPNASGALYFARPYDLKVGTIKDRLQIARPTIFLGVPLVWEKIADKLRAIGAKTTGAKKMVADWAKGKSLAYGRNILLGGSRQAPFGLGVANKLLGKIKQELGLDQCKFALTGAAPIRVDTLEYFASLGIFINEVFGMSETTGCMSFSTEVVHLWGSCGYCLAGSELKAFKVDDLDFNKKREAPRAPTLEDTDEQYMGELCFRGRNIMMGYLAQSDLGQAHVDEISKKTAETIDKDGWLHSGDKGMITQAGMVKITGRYKELIIGEGGENIAPVPIEDAVKKACDGINEVMMVGDKRKYNVALITLKAVGANGEVPGTDDLDAGACRINPDVQTISAAMKDTVWIEQVTKAITAANNNGKVCPNNAFKIQKFCILPTNFSEENNELTPTKKLKRAVVADGYKALIDKMYSTEGVYIPYEAKQASSDGTGTQEANM